MIHQGIRNYLYCFYLPSNFKYMKSRKNSGDIDVLPVNQLEIYDTSGNKEIAVYCFLQNKF